MARSKSLVFTLIASAIVFASAGRGMPSLTSEGPKWSWSDCTSQTPKAVGRVQSVTISPDPSRGAAITYALEGIIEAAIQEGAYGTVTVKHGEFIIFQRKYDICKEGQKAGQGLDCPISAGYHKVEETIRLPTILPAGLSARIAGYTSDGEEIGCIDVHK